MSIEQKQVFIVEDHPVTRQGIIGILNGEQDLSVCGEASSAEAAIELILSSKPDLVISDIALEGRNGLDLLKDLKTIQPSLKVLMISMYPEAVYAQRALKAGASGYVMKEEAPETIVTAVRHALAGNIFVSPRISTQILAAFTGQSTVGADPVETLSDRELQVFEHIGNGQGNKEIADLMNLSPRTVESYRARVKEKMGYPDGRTLVREAIRWYDAHRGGPQSS